MIEPVERAKSKVYVIKMAYGSFKARKRIKVESGVEPTFQLVPVFGVGVVIDGVLKTFIPLTEIEREDAEQLFDKYGVEKGAIVAIVSEIAEETKSENELHLD